MAPQHSPALLQDSVRPLQKYWQLGPDIPEQQSSLFQRHYIGLFRIIEESSGEVREDCDSFDHMKKTISSAIIELGKVIKRERKLRQLTQTQLGELSETSINFISQVEAVSWLKGRKRDDS